MENELINNVSPQLQTLLEILATQKRGNKDLESGIVNKQI